MKILITRHGEIDDDKGNILMGQKEADLTEIGQQQAKDLAKKLEVYTIDQIYCSPMQRNRDTIAPYLEQHPHVPIHYTEEIKEMDLGIFNGTLAEQSAPERKKGFDHKIGGGESLRDIYHRAKDFLKEIKEKHKDETILIVGHKAINRNIIGIINNDSIEEINRKKERYPFASILSFDIF